MNKVTCNQGEMLCLIRYVKPGYIKNNGITDEVFQLREDRKPPEEYVSFFHSHSCLIGEKIRDVKTELEKRKFKISTTCGFINLNASKASAEINITNTIIEFKEESYPHYGMYYLSDDEMDIIEAKSILIHHSELHMNIDYICLTTNPSK